MDTSNTEKEETYGVTEDSKELPSDVSASNNNSIEELDEPVPHLHAKTFLTVFAVCLIYFAQLINVVGAGAVSISYNYMWSQECPRRREHSLSTKEQLTDSYVSSMHATSPPLSAAPPTRYGSLRPSPS